MVEDTQKFLPWMEDKQLRFLTSSQSIPKSPCSHSDSSATSCLVGQDDESSGQPESIFTEDLQIDLSRPSTATPYVEPRADSSSGQIEILFTKDLQINWSALTTERLEQISQELRRNEKDAIAAEAAAEAAAKAARKVAAVAAAIAEEAAEAERHRALARFLAMDASFHEKGTHLCSECGAKCKSRQGLRKHVRSKHMVRYNMGDTFL